MPIRYNVTSEFGPNSTQSNTQPAELNKFKSLREGVETFSTFAPVSNFGNSVLDSGDRNLNAAFVSPSLDRITRKNKLLKLETIKDGRIPNK
jgi:hypothetical protein